MLLTVALTVKRYLLCIALLCEAKTRFTRRTNFTGLNITEKKAEVCCSDCHVFLSSSSSSIDSQNRVDSSWFRAEGLLGLFQRRLGLACASSSVAVHLSLIIFLSCVNVCECTSGVARGR